MKQPARIALAAAAVAGIAALEWWAVSRTGASELSVSLYLLASLVVSADLFDLLVRLYLRRVHTVPERIGRVAPTSLPLHVPRFRALQVRLHLRPWALVASVRNLGRDAGGFVDRLGTFADRLWVIDDGSTDDTAERLERAGVRVVRGGINRRKPAAIRELLRALPPDVVTVVVLDPDVRIVGGLEEGVHPLERALFEFQRSRAAAMCPRIVVRPDGWLATFQDFEYSMAFALGRKSMADRCITSGVAVYRRDALERVLEDHTLSVYAEDLKNAVLLLARGEAIYYDGRLVIETDGKRTLPAWFSQRVGWFYGLIKVWTENWRDVLRVADRRLVLVYQFVIYAGVLTIALHPLKLAALGLLAASTANGADNLLGLGLVPDTAWNDPRFFALSWAKYLLLALVALLLAVNRGDRLRLLPVAPFYFFYALAHLVPITVGYLNWASLRVAGRRVYRDHYQEETTLVEERRRRAG